MKQKFGISVRKKDLQGEGKEESISRNLFLGVVFGTLQS